MTNRKLRHVHFPANSEIAVAILFLVPGLFMLRPELVVAQEMHSILEQPVADSNETNVDGGTADSFVPSINPPAINLQNPPGINPPASIGEFQMPAINDAPVQQSQQMLHDQMPRDPSPDGTENPNEQPDESQVDESQINIDRILTRLVLNSMPHTFEEDKNWGRQAERFDGLEIERDGLRIETRRKKKLVNHGTWKKYSAQLVNPEQEFTVQLTNLHRTRSGKTGFDVHFSANLDLQARQSKWVKGVQMYSLSAEGHAQIRLVVGCEMGVETSFKTFPPDLIFSPEAKSAEIIVDEFRIDRISKLGGEFAQQVSRRARRELDKKINDQEHRLVKKINSELEENQDKLRLSTADAVKSRWAEPAKAFLPESVQHALDAVRD